MSDQLAEVRTQWDHLSGWLDQQMAYNCLSAALALQLAVGARLGGRVLEVGCGTGQAAHLLLGCLDVSEEKAVEFTALDISPKMAAISKQRLADFGHVKDVVVGNAERLPFDDCSFDRLYSNLCLHLTPDADEMLKESARVLVPGGQAAFSIWGRPEQSRMMEILPEAMFEAGLIPKLPPQRQAYRLGRDLEALQRRAKAAGFSSCQTWRSTMPCSQSPESYCSDFCKAPTTAKMLEALSREKREEFSEVIKAKAQAAIDAGIPIALEVVIIHATK